MIYSSYFENYRKFCDSFSCKFTCSVKPLLKGSPELEHIDLSNNLQVKGEVSATFCGLNKLFAVEPVT